MFDLTACLSGQKITHQKSQKCQILWNMPPKGLIILENATEHVLIDFWWATFK